MRSDLYVASTGDARATLGREPDESARSEQQANGARDAGRFAELGISRAHKPRLVAEDLTVDQNVDNPAEVDRVEAAGGLVEPAEGYMQNRIWNSERHLGPGLQMTRSVGDHDADRLGVMPDPVVTHRKLHKTDRVLILATDGVWEYITSEMAVRFVELTLGRFKDDAHVAEKAAIVLAKFGDAPGRTRAATIATISRARSCGCRRSRSARRRARGAIAGALRSSRGPQLIRATSATVARSRKPRKQKPPVLLAKRTVQCSQLSRNRGQPVAP